MSDQSYFQQRMSALGITEAHNTIEVWHSGGEETVYSDTLKQDVTRPVNILKPVPVFRETEKGIDILVYNIDRQRIKYTKESKWKHDYCITRLESPIHKANGDVIKYLKPKGEPSYPFFPPRLVDKYCNAGKIDTLYLTEGFFKAFKADMHGIWCVGVQSITCLRDKETNAIWQDILKLIETCKVERLVWLTDGDYMNITSKDIADGVDLSKRPNVFYSSVYTFSEITSQLKDVERYFAHINSDDLDGHPKGLDDVLCAFPDRLQEIQTEFNNFSIMAPGKVYPGKYITRINISINTGRVRQYFNLDDVTKFYLYHLERRPEIGNLKNFCFYGTIYRYDDKEGKCVIEVPKSANDYIRVGNDYYQHITYPDKWQQLHKAFDLRTKGTIKDDNGVKIFDHIQKYYRFVCVPSHTNFQQIVHGCYNLYHPFVHEPEEGDYEKTLAFIKHIFGTDTVKYNFDGQILEIPRYELALDYLTLLYTKPQQILPILCLVSPDRQTGKTTFINWLDKLFAENVITIGNEDMKQDFNAHWVSKLVICCDETKLDKDEVIQKIKRLSTADKVVMNSKGKDQVTLDFFAKFILISNDEEDFIRIDKNEIRFWVIRVSALEKVDTELLPRMIEEIPAFLHYISNRKMVTQKKERHWFDTQLLKTPALEAVIANSMPTSEKRIRLELKEWFEFTNLEVLTFPLNYFSKEVIKGLEKTYLVKTLHKMGYKSKSGRIKYPVHKQVVSAESVMGQPPIMETIFEMVATNTTYYEFNRNDFTTTPVQPKETKEDLPF